MKNRRRNRKYQGKVWSRRVMKK